MDVGINKPFKEKVRSQYMNVMRANSVESRNGYPSKQKTEGESYNDILVNTSRNEKQCEWQQNIGCNTKQSLD